MFHNVQRALIEPTVRSISIIHYTEDHMKPTVQGGLVLGVATGLWTLVMGVSGWYKDPAMVNVFYLIILVEIGVLIWGLRKTAPNNTYWQQVGAGMQIALIGSVIIFLVSILFTTVLYPNYFTDLQTMQAQMLRQAGRSETEISTVLNAAKSMQTPVINGLMGVIGTVVTAFLASLGLGGIFRKK
jgi:hypothetical protein